MANLASSAVRRLRRTAKNVPKGVEIIELLASPKMRKVLIAAAERGEAPVGAASSQLAALLDAKTAKLTQVKQFAGRCVRAILEDEGYEIEGSRVWLGGDPIFSTGAVYRKVTRQTGVGQNEMLERFVSSLTEDEAGVLAKILARRSRK